MEWTTTYSDWQAAARFGDLVVIGERAVPRKITASRGSIDDNRAEVTVVVEVVQGVPRCQEVHVCAIEGGREVRPTDLKIDVDDLVEGLVAAFSVPVEHDKAGGSARIRPALTAAEARAAVAGVRGARKGRTPRTITDRFLERVAAVYLAAPEHPRRAVALAFDVSDRMAAEYVRQCRAHKPPLIPAAKGGK